MEGCTGTVSRPKPRSRRSANSTSRSTTSTSSLARYSKSASQPPCQTHPQSLQPPHERLRDGQRQGQTSVAPGPNPCGDPRQSTSGGKATGATTFPCPASSGSGPTTMRAPKVRDTAAPAVALPPARRRSVDTAMAHFTTIAPPAPVNLPPFSTSVAPPSSSATPPPQHHLQNHPQHLPQHTPQRCKAARTPTAVYYQRLPDSQEGYASMCFHS